LLFICLAVLPSVSYGQQKKTEKSTPLFRIEQNEKCGFIDRTGQIVIEPQYDNAYPFSEGRVGNLLLKNRLIRAAAFMGASPDGYFSDQGVAIYKALAEGGVGLIFSGHMTVMIPESKGEMYIGKCIYDDKFTPSIRKIANVVHQVGNDCKIIAQINHVGMQDIVNNPVSLSGVGWPRI